MKHRIKRWAKTVRAIQPFNSIATETLRTLADRFDRVPVDLLAKYLPPAGEVTSRLPNDQVMRLWSDAGPDDDQLARVVFWKGWHGYQPATTRCFWSLATSSTYTVDVGAHIGFYTIMAALANQDGRVASFEALPHVFGRLQRNISLNQLTNVDINQIAVGDHVGELDFFHVRDGFPSSSSLSSDFMHDSLPDHMLASTSVKVITLDNYVDRNGIDRVDLVKLDTESTEPEVLAGMQATLRRDRPNIICEVLPWRDAGARLESILRIYDYRYYALTPFGPELRASIQSNGERWDYLFTHMSPEELRTAIAANSSPPK